MFRGALVMRVARSLASKNITASVEQTVKGHNMHLNMCNLMHQQKANFASTSQFSKKAGKRYRPLDTSAESAQDPSSYATAQALALARRLDLDGALADVEIGRMYEQSSVNEDIDNAIYLRTRGGEKTNQLHEVFLFNDGVAVFWNIEQTQRDQLLFLLGKHVDEPHDPELIREEVETMPYQMGSGKAAIKKGMICLNSSPNENEHDTGGRSSILERFSFSHAIAASVKIAIWEAELNKQAEPLAKIAKALTAGRVLWKRKETLEKMGEFAELRHSMNLADLLCEDFYWDRPELERLYTSLSRYFAVNKRLDKMDERLEYCERLVNVIDNVLQHRHSSFLEWIIILLICVEVVFDIWHCVDRLTERKHENP